MISKNKLKFIKSLQLKKYRGEYNRFLVEGAKNVEELLRSDFEVESVLVSPSYYAKQKSILTGISPEVIQVDEDQLSAIGTFSSNNAAIAVAVMKENKSVAIPSKGYMLALDEIRDPGNLGTIVRIADWYGIHQIVCTSTTAEFYNPKVIAASMGSFTRVQIYYTDLYSYLKQYSGDIFGAFLKGENIHKFSFPEKGIIVMGNESDGISEEIEKLVTKKITIPSYGAAESLNVSVATAVVLDNLRRE